MFAGLTLYNIATTSNLTSASFVKDNGERKMRVMAENPMGRQRSGWRYKLYRAGRGIRRNWGLYLLLLPAVVLLFCFNYLPMYGVQISTSNNAHFEVAKAAIEAGKPFCLEKPVTLTAEEADILAKAAQEKGIPNMVCFSYRFKAAARYAKELVEKGMLGDIYHVYMQYLQGGGGPSYDLPRSWRYQKELTGTGALGDLGCHALDLVSFVTGKNYRKAVGHTDTYVTQRRLEEGEGYGPVDVDDFCHYLMEMDGKTSANFSVTRFAYGRGNYQRMEIYGSKGGLVYSLDVTPGVDELEVCFGYPYDRSGIYTKLPIPQRFQCDQMQSFADILNGCSDGMAATIQDGCRIQHALDVIIRSAEEEKWLPCD